MPAGWRTPPPALKVDPATPPPRVLRRPSSLALAAISYVLPGACPLTPIVDFLDTCTYSKRRRMAAMANVLVAEDNVDVADTLALLLETEGHEVHVVEDGVAALAEADRRLPDAAVLDIGLPFLSGIEVAYSLRQQYGDNLRLVACTGYDDDATRSKIVRAGFDVVLTKPAPVGELLDAVASADLGRGRSASDRRQRRRPRHVTERFG